jgi:hypothetical protein
MSWISLNAKAKCGGDRQFLHLTFASRGNAGRRQLARSEIGELFVNVEIQAAV